MGGGAGPAEAGRFSVSGSSELTRSGRDDPEFCRNCNFYYNDFRHIARLLPNLVKRRVVNDLGATRQASEKIGF